MKPLFTIAALLGLATTAQAQSSVSFGPRLGLNLSNTNFSIPGGSIETTSKAGALVGLAANFGFGKWAVQPALLYSQQGFNINDSDQETFLGTTYKSEATGEFSFNYINVPVNLVYSVKDDGTGFQLFVGPYLGFGIGGHASIEQKLYENGQLMYSEKNEADVKNDNKDAADDYLHNKGLDGGINGGIGYRMGALQVQAGYSAGLSQVAADTKDSDEQVKYPNQMFQFSLTYLLNLKN